jgi:hypothetical protein
MAVEQSTRSAQAAAEAAAAAAEAAPAPTIVTVSLMDSVVPTIPEVTIDDVERKMPHPTLTRIEGEPDYASMSIVREELTRNAIASKSTFGGGGSMDTTVPSSTQQRTQSTLERRGECQQEEGFTPLLHLDGRKPRRNWR